MAHRKSKIPYTKRKREQNPVQEKIKPQFSSHHLYGKVPMLAYYYENAAGERSIAGYYADPDFKPKLPEGAIPGNVALQEFCPIHHFPKYFYVDIHETCVQCGKEFVFSGKEQKFWYETKKFNFHSQAIRCQNCRKEKRNEKALMHQLQYAYKACEEYPDDPYAHLSVSEAICIYYMKLQKGDLERAIAEARFAKNLDPTCVEALFYEGIAQSLSNRPQKSEQLLLSFLEQAAGKLRYKNLISKARVILYPS